MYIKTCRGSDQQGFKKSLHFFFCLFLKWPQSTFFPCSFVIYRHFWAVFGITVNYIIQRSHKPRTIMCYNALTNQWELFPEKMYVTLLRIHLLYTDTNFRPFYSILLVLTATVPASGKQPAKMFFLSVFFLSKRVLILWGYGDMLALVKEILIQTEYLKLNEHLVHAPHPLKVCVECSWGSFKKILLIGIICGGMWPPAVQCFTNFLSLCDPMNTSRPSLGSASPQGPFCCIIPSSGAID